MKQKKLERHCFPGEDRSIMNYNLYNLLTLKPYAFFDLSSQPTLDIPAQNIILRPDTSTATGWSRKFLRRFPFCGCSFHFLSAACCCCS
jgi:hypothetical protein